MIEYRYDTQLYIDGRDLSEKEITEYFADHFLGDSFRCMGSDKRIRIHFHTNRPWEILAYCSTLGEIYDIVVEDMIRQSKGLKG